MHNMTMQKPNYCLFIILISLMAFSCEERPKTNPFDSNTDLDPSEWAPTNLQAVVLSDSEIKLTWEQEVKPIEGFRIECQANFGIREQIGDIVADGTQYIDSMLNLVENSYLYRIRAYTVSNVSGYSNYAGTNIAIDIDGNVHNTVKIGDQWWMAENLKVTHYRNGDVIPIINDAEEETITSGAFSYYQNNPSYADTYGGLYNWYAVNDSRNIAPEGWHVPSDAEWQTLVDYLGGNNVAGGTMKEIGTTHWNSPNTGATNGSGFTALPGGYRFFDIGDSFGNLGDDAYFWSSTEYDSHNAWYRGLDCITTDVHWDYNDKQHWYSIRCVRD